MGSPLRGRGLSVLDRNEGLVSPLRSGTLVRSWLDLPPLSAGICAPGPQGVLPGGAPLTVGLLPGSPTLLCPLSAGCPLGWEASPSGEASASSFRFSWRPGAAGALAVTLPEAASQREFFPVCLILPLPGSVSFSRVCSSVGGHAGVAHTFLPSLLLGGGLVRFCGGLCWRSLALSWAYPPPFLCVGLIVCSRRIVAPLAPCLSGWFPSVFGVRFALRRGVSPGVGPVGALGELRWLHLYLLTPDLVGLLLFAGCLGAPVGVLCLLCDITPVFMAIFWSVSLTPACPLLVPPMRGCPLDTCVACTWLDFMSSSVLFQDSVI